MAQCYLVKRGSDVKDVTEQTLYIGMPATYSEALCEIGFLSLLKAETITTHISQQNANSSTTITWNFCIEGLIAGSDEWETLASETIKINAGQTYNLEKTYNISTNNYHSKYRVNIKDPKRTSQPTDWINYIKVSGKVKL